MPITFGVMAGLVPAIHVLIAYETVKTWMPAPSAGMTREAMRARVPTHGWRER
jgi:hypothetical protein